MPAHLPKPLHLTSLPLRPSPINLPFLHPRIPPHRLASILSSLSDNPTAFSQPQRLGRGPSSGRGKTSTRGHKGQKQHGKVPRGFNGGQTKDEVVSGKRGDHNFASFQKTLTPLNLSTLQLWIHQNRIDPTHPITIRELLQSRCVSNVKDGVKLLAKTSGGTSSQPTGAPLPAMNVVVSRASASAIKAIEAAGGSVTTRYYTPFAVRQIRRGRMDPVNSLGSRVGFAEGGGKSGVDGAEGSSVEGGAQAGEAMGKREEGFRYRLPDPTSRKDIEYYRDPAKRGYLSWMVPEGQGPSLFYKTPGTGRTIRRSVKGGKREGENRIW